MGSLAAWEIGILALLRRIDWMQRWSLNAAPICWAGSSKASGRAKLTTHVATARQRWSV